MAGNKLADGVFGFRGRSEQRLGVHNLWWAQLAPRRKSRVDTIKPGGHVGPVASAGTTIRTGPITRAMLAITTALTTDLEMFARGAVRTMVRGGRALP